MEKTVKPVGPTSLTAAGTPVTSISPRDDKGTPIEPRPSTPVPDLSTHRRPLRHFILLDSGGNVVGHADDLRDAQPMADDLAIGLYPQALTLDPTGGPGDANRVPDLPEAVEPKFAVRGVTVYQKVSHHAARAFSKVELSERTPEGTTVVERKLKRAKLVVAAAKKEVAESLVHLDHAPNQETSDDIAASTKALKPGSGVVGGSGAAAKPAKAQPTYEAREAELNALSAAEVKDLAAKAGVEGKTKAENVENLLDAEF